MTQHKSTVLLDAIDRLSPKTAAATETQKKLEDQLKDTRKTVSETNRQLSQIDAYNKQIKATSQAQNALKKYQTQLANQKKELEGIDKPTRTQLDRLATLEQRVDDATLAFNDKSKALDKLKGDLVSAGIETADLTRETQRLTTKSAAFTREAQKQGQELADLKRKQIQVAQSHADAARRADHYITQIKKATKANRDLAAAEAKVAKERKQAAMQKVGEGATGAVMAGGAIAAGSGMAAVSTETSYTNFKNSSKLTEEQNAELFKYALDVKASRAGQGLTMDEIFKAMQGAVETGAKSTDDVKDHLNLVLQMRQSTDKDRFDTWEVNKQAKNMAKAGYTSDETAAFHGAVVQSYTGDDINDVYDGLKETVELTKAKGIDRRFAEASVLAFANAGRTGSSAGSAIEQSIEYLTIGKSANKSQKEAATMIGMSNEQIAKMAQTDMIGLIETITKRMKGLDEGQRSTVSEQLFGGEFLVWQTIMQDGSLKKSFELLGNEAANAAELQRRASNVQETSQGGLEQLTGAFNRLATIVGEPLLEPLNAAADWTAEKINGLADWIDGLEDSTVQAGAAIIGLGAAALAANKALTIIAALKGLAGLGGKGLAASTARTAVSAGAKVGARGAASIAGRVAGGSAMLPLTLLASAKEYDPNDSAIAKANKTPEAQAAYMAMYSKKIPTPEQFDKKSEEVKKTESTKIIKVDVSGKVEGLTPDGEKKLIDQMTASAYQAMAHPLEREGY